jgi:hypothetical protein
VFSSYPKHLIEETIQCFKEENGIHLSAEEASHYLDSFAELFLAFADVSQEVDSSQNIQVKTHELCVQVN